MQYFWSETSKQEFRINLEVGLRWKAVRLIFAIPFFSLIPGPALPQDQPAGTWLDSAPVQWNTPGASFPKAPQDVEKNVTPEYCKAHQRPVRLQEERVVAGAGWLVFTSLQGNNSLTVVGGAFSLDGMCRPDPYQCFVLVREEYVGILSPS